MKIYLIGSLRNKEIPTIAAEMRETGLDIFDDWYAPGPEADDYWRKYEIERGRDFLEALEGHAAKHIFEFDKSHIDSSHVGVLVLPAGKSAHMELGYMLGQGKPGYILLDNDPERWDVMYQFATGVFRQRADLIQTLERLNENF